MDDEIILFDEAIGGDKFLVTSKVVIFKGVQLETSKIDAFSASAFRQAVNAIPTNASYKIAIAAEDKSIGVDCAGYFWFGQGQYQRLHSAIYKAAGERLYVEAIRKLINGGTLEFKFNGSAYFFLEKSSHFALSSIGLHVIEQNDFKRRDMMIEWRDLGLQMANGRCYFEKYSTRQKTSFDIGAIPNNFVFCNVLHYVMDKARYRDLFSEDKLRSTKTA